MPKTAAKARAARTARRARANATTKVVAEDIRRSGVVTLAGIAKVLEARGVRTPAGPSDMAGGPGIEVDGRLRRLGPCDPRLTHMQVARSMDRSCG
jgi:hypothetical protein